jgi:ATP-dependent DNA helicase RecQ
MEDVKHEQLLMITFSRAAASEFKKRLLQLIGNAANYIEIKTFHSYCFDLLGKIGNLEKSDDILKKTVEKINSQEVEASRITKTVLVIDEAQDMDQDEFELVQVLMEKNEDMRVIAVGDDDQNIFEFRGANSKYLEQFIVKKQAVKHELVENFRSENNLVSFANNIVSHIQFRLKQTPILSHRQSNGSIKLFHYQSNHLMEPLIEDILQTKLSGTTCVLTKTNEEALQITGSLTRHGLKAKLIQSNDGFNVYQINEVRYFLKHLHLNDNAYTIGEDLWRNAKRAVAQEFKKSTKLDLLGNIIREFEAVNPRRKYKSDLEIFIREAKLEDFYHELSDTIIVSTIHKAKGKEFDHVFMMLENFAITSDQDIRLLYVGVTRAKKNLSIHHHNADFFQQMKTEGMVKIENTNSYSAPKELAIHLTFKDLWLDYFIHRQHWISYLKSGDELTVMDDACIDSKGNTICKFSKQFKTKLETLKAKNYYPKNAKVNFILFWKKENSDQELKIVLPELFFERMGS